MKIFAIYLRVNLTEKPEWLDSFRSEYSSTSILHITLVQPRYIHEDQIQDIKDKVSEVLSKEKIDSGDKELIFDKTELEEDVDRYLLMSFINENESILNLQKKLVEALKNFDSYCSEETKEYEANFQPHLTIADKIDSGSKDIALKLASENNTLKGNIMDLVLAIVNEQSVSESENPDNWIIFHI